MSRTDDYVAGFRDGYERAVQEVSELLDIAAIDDELGEVKRRARLIERAAKVIGIIWR